VSQSFNSFKRKILRNEIRNAIRNAKKLLIKSSSILQNPPLSVPPVLGKPLIPHLTTTKKAIGCVFE
jgi:hypothetical protein